jgi:EAL domain-containing protein (putative c-di-GMP-specific phosphodiesterase class I)
MLKMASERINKITRTLDTSAFISDDSLNVARLSGNSFIISIVDLKNTQIALTIYDRIISSLNNSYILDEITIEAVCYSGIAHYPEHGSTPDELLQHADTAATHAKISHQPYCIYSSDFDTDMRKNLLLLQELKTAIKDDSLELYLQPKIELVSHKISGAECLLRWSHPVHGFIPPNVFVKIAEETGQITNLSKWVIENAAKLIKVLENNSLCPYVSINLTASDIINPEIIEFLLNCFNTNQIKTQYLTIEITESSMISDPQQAHAVIKVLAETGFKLSIDDFGTGYSSLSYLQKLSVHELKIDKSFVFELDKNRENEMIVRSIIDIAHHLGLSVVAEGIESKDIYDMLVHNGCDHAQGFYMSRPLPLEKAIDFYREYTTRVDSGKIKNNI